MVTTVYRWKNNILSDSMEKTIYSSMWTTFINKPFEFSQYSNELEKVVLVNI